MTRDQWDTSSSAANDNMVPKTGAVPLDCHLPRRFYKEAGFKKMSNGYAILLDARPIKTPLKAELRLPAESLAKAIVKEWQTQQDVIDPRCMPLTRLANTAIDRVLGYEREIVDEIIHYARSDLLCYRAGTPAGLVDKQSVAWDPLLAWAEQELRAKMSISEGIVHVSQPDDAIANVRDAVAALDHFALTSLHNMTTLTGSCLIALAVGQGQINAVDAWNAAHIDEDWQIGQWGEDVEAEERRKRRWAEFQASHSFMVLAWAGETIG